VEGKDFLIGNKYRNLKTEYLNLLEKKNNNETITKYQQQRMEAIVKYLDVSQWKKREKVRKTTPSDSSMESESISNNSTSKVTKQRETRMNDRIRKGLQTKGAGGVTNIQSDNESTKSGDSSQSRSSSVVSCSKATTQHQRNKGNNKQQQLRNSDTSATVTKGTNNTDKETNDKTVKKKKGNNKLKGGERGSNDRTVTTSRVGRKLKKKRLSFPPEKY